MELPGIMASIITAIAITGITSYVTVRIITDYRVQELKNQIYDYRIENETNDILLRQHQQDKIRAEWQEAVNQITKRHEKMGQVYNDNFTKIGKLLNSIKQDTEDLILNEILDLIADTIVPMSHNIDKQNATIRSIHETCNGIVEQTAKLTITQQEEERKGKEGRGQIARLQNTVNKLGDSIGKTQETPAGLLIERLKKIETEFNELKKTQQERTQQIQQAYDRLNDVNQKHKLYDVFHRKVDDTIEQLQQSVVQVQLDWKTYEEKLEQLAEDTNNDLQTLYAECTERRHDLEKQEKDLQTIHEANRDINEKLNDLSDTLDQFNQLLADANQRTIAQTSRLETIIEELDKPLANGLPINYEADDENDENDYPRDSDSDSEHEE